MTARADLAKVIHDATCPAGKGCLKPRDIHYNMEDPQRIADAVIAAGWAPTRSAPWHAEDWDAIFGERQ